MFGDIFPDDDQDVDTTTQLGVREQFLRPPERRAETGFVGLENQGATCYLNSLIQSMFMTPELRKGLFDVDPVQLGVLDIDEYERQKNSDSKKGIVEAEESLVEQMKAMGFNEHGARQSLIATNNSVDAAFEYYDVHQSDPGFFIEPMKPTTKKKRPRLIPLELQSLFTRMQCLQQKALSTEELTTKGFQWQGMDGRVQHDAHELNRLLIEALEKSLKNTSGENLCKVLYNGMLANQITCEFCSNVSERTEAFYDLNVQVLSCEDLVQSLRKYCAAEVLEGDSAYQCDVCECKRRAQRASVIRSLPPLLTFSLNRFKIDRSTNWQREKVLSRSTFPLFLDMENFIESSPSKLNTLEGTEEIETVLLKELRSKMTWLDSAVEHANAIAVTLLEKYGLDASIESLDSTDKELLHSMMNTKNTADDRESDHLYQLLTVIMHRGSAHSGHYFAYIRDCFEEGNWTMADSAFEDSNYLYTRKDAKKTTSTSISEAMYYITSTGELNVKETTPLSHLCSSFMKCYLIENEKFVVTVDKLGVELKKKLNGKTWANVHKDKHGTLLEFIKRQNDIFEMQGNKVYLKSMMPVVIPVAEFDTLVSSQKDTVVESTGQSDELSDEALARALQESLNADITASKPKEESVVLPENEEWMTATTTKKKKGKSTPANSSDDTSSSVKSSQISTSDVNEIVISSVTSSVDTTVDSNSNTYNIRHRKLVEDILARQFGRFYEFNDSVVKPMLTKDIGKAFEGSDSAYLLVYRKVDRLPSSQCASEGVSSDDVFSEGVSSDFERPTPPFHWMEKVETMNKDLDEARTRFEAQSHVTTIKVLCPWHVKYNFPFAYLEPADLLLTNNVPENICSGIELNIDVRDTISQISIALSEMCTTCAVSMLNESLDSKEDNCTVALSVLKKYGDGYSVQESIKEDAFIGDVIEKNSLLIVWNGATLNGVSVPVGVAATPLKYSITLLCMKEDSRIKSTVQSPNLSKVTSSRVDKVQAIEDFWVACSTTVPDACLQACQLFGLDSKRACIHLLYTKPACATTSSSGKSKNNNTSNIIRTLLWDKGPVTKSIGSKTQKKTIAQAMLSELDGLELLVEDIEARGMSTCSLAELEVRRRGMEWVIHVDLDLKSRISATSASDVQDDSMPNIRLIKIDIEKSAKISMLKEMAICLFGLDVNELFSTTCLRVAGTGLLASDGVLENEDLSLLDAGLRDGFNLTLEEIGKIAQTNTIIIKVCKVTGNDTAQKFNPYNPGDEGEVVEMEVALTDTIVQVKDRAGILLRELPEGWALTENSHSNVIVLAKHPTVLNTPSSTTMSSERMDNTQEIVKDQVFLGMHRNFRLRRTNWNQEAGDVICEVGEQREHLTVASADLQNDCILRFEEGHSQPKNVISYQIYLWVHSFDASSHSSYVHAAASVDSPPFPPSDSPEDSNISNEDKNEYEYLNVVEKERLKSYFSLGSIECHEDCLLQDLQEAVLKLLGAERNALEALIPQYYEPTSHEGFVIRELNTEMLPGKCFWLDEHQYSIPDDFVSLTKKGGSFLPNAQKSLRKVSLHGKQPLCIQIFPKDTVQASNLPAPYAITVWAQLLSNPYEVEEGKSVMVPNWPPKQLWIVGGHSPTLGFLKNSLCEKFQLNKEKVAIFKYSYINCAWFELKAAMKAQGGGKGGKKTKSSSKPENITEGPYSVKDGDLICAFERSDDVTSAGTESGEAPIIVSRLQDVLMKKMKLEEKDSKKKGNTKVAKDGGNKKVAKNAPEVMLSLGGNLDFSDDELDN